MRLFVAEFLQGGVHTEEEIVRAAVERFMVQGERIHGVRGLALQILKALEAEGALFFSDGIYRSATSSTVTVKPVAVEKIPETKRKTAVKVQKATKVKARSPQLLAAGRAVLDEKKFSALLNEQGGAYFNVFVAKLLESYYASVGVRVSGRFVVDGSEDKGIDVVFHTRDELGISDKVAVQAKTRARSQITLKELREFYGCVHAEGATKGIFITTATFTTEAVEFLHRSVDLAGIDSAKLFELASRFEIGICHRDGKPYPAPELTV
jgi:restriction endonuclease Mrr